MKKKAIVCDIDGVVLKSDFLLKEIYEKKLKGDEKWEYFDRECNSDRVKLIPSIKPFLNSFEDNVHIIISTARNERCRKGTSNKLWRHRICFDEMYMRAIDDYRDATEVKRDHFKKILEEYEVICFVDDSLENCEVAKEFGILALRCV